MTKSRLYASTFSAFDLPPSTQHVASVFQLLRVYSNSKSKGSPPNSNSQFNPAQKLPRLRQKLPRLRRHCASQAPPLSSSTDSENCIGGSPAPERRLEACRYGVTGTFSGGPCAPLQACKCTHGTCSLPRHTTVSAPLSGRRLRGGRAAGGRALPCDVHGPTARAPAFAHRHTACNVPTEVRTRACGGRGRAASGRALPAGILERRRVRQEALLQAQPLAGVGRLDDRPAVTVQRDHRRCAPDRRRGRSAAPARLGRARRHHHAARATEILVLNIWGLAVIGAAAKARARLPSPPRWSHHRAFCCS